jgi:CheY-like chemotaxis protein
MPKMAAISRKHILVVDDEPFVCDAVKMMLDFDGHSVETAHSAKDALAMFEDGKFDLVITETNWRWPSRRDRRSSRL